MRIPGLQQATPRTYRGPATGGQTGAVWRAFASIALAVGAIALLGEAFTNPSKRNIEIVAGVAFLLFVIASHPVRAFYLALAMLPFHVSLFVGTTTTLLIFAVGAIVLAKAKSMHLDPPLRDSRLNMFLFGWVLTMILSFARVPGSEMWRSLIVFQAFLASLVLMFTMTRLVRTERDLQNMLRTIMFVVLVTAVISLLQASFPERSWLPTIFNYEARQAQSDVELVAGQVRAFATYSGYEFFAELMAIAVIVMFVLARMATTAKEGVFWMGGMGICLTALVASATRGPVLALVVALVWMITGSRGAIPRAHVVGLLFVGTLMLVGVAFTFPHLVEQMMSRMSEDLTRADSMESREVAWRQAIEAIARSPLLGHGLVVPPGTWKGGVSMNLHSLYLHLAYTIGIPGLLLFGGVMFRLFQISLARARDRRQTPFVRHVMMGMNAAIVLFLIDQLKIEYLRSPIDITVTWSLFGVVLCAEKLARLAHVQDGLDILPALEWIPADDER